jgi:hypothetical protein
LPVPGQLSLGAGWEQGCNKTYVMETLLEMHEHAYMEHAKASYSVLEEAWNSLDLSMEERRVELQITMDAASSAWGAAVARADQRRLSMLSEIESMQREASRIAEQLGAQHCQVSCGASLQLQLQVTTCVPGACAGWPARTTPRWGAPSCGGTTRQSSSWGAGGTGGRSVCSSRRSCRCPRASPCEP